MKAGSPSRTWLMNPKSNRGLPPQYPYRRGSTAPMSTLVSDGIPNRSRSLDGLLNSEPKIAEDAPNPSETGDDESRTRDFEQTDSHTNLNGGNIQKARSAEDILDSPVAKKSDDGSCSESKRKRNFMDRCVNKVRNLIRK